MNTLGKILVILNFVFALVVCYFLAVDFATRQNWKTTIDQYRKELEVSRANNAALDETSRSLFAQLQQAKADQDTKRLDIKLQQAEFSIKLDDLQSQVKEAEQRGKLAEINFEKALAASERMKKEVEGLKTIVDDREGRLVKLHKQYTESQSLVMSLDRDLKFSQERNQIMVGRIQELERYIAELQTGSRTDGVASKGVSQPNPPARFVKGVVEQVSKDDKTLIRVSLGTDHGIKVSNTLEVYRTNPPEYVGMIRIEDAHHHTSVGRLLPTPGVRKQVREGDIVSSSLNPR